jgi:hypothetical protein
MESLFPARTAAAVISNSIPVRTAFLYFPNGVWKPDWIPQETGKNFALSPTLKPLADHKNDILVLSGLDKPNSRSGDGHYAKTANFLTGLPVAKTSGANINSGGVSVDQVIAQHYKGITPLPSLELGTEPVVSGIDGAVGYTRLYGGHISWKAADKPLAKEINPKLVYERLFGQKQQGSHEFKPLLDFVLEDAKQLRGRLGRDDRFKMDEYLDSVRSVEERIEYASRPDHRPWKPNVSLEQIALSQPGIPQNFRDHVRTMLDLMVLAFRTDSTRVTSFMFANDVSTRSYSFLDGVRDSHHALSHHQNEADKIAQYQKINTWHVEQLAYFLTKLKSVEEGESNLLHNSMIMFGSSMSDGNSHDPNNLPIILAGHAGGRINSGQHLVNPQDTPLCNLYLTMLQKLNLPIPAFGDSNNVLANV